MKITVTTTTTTEIEVEIPCFRKDGNSVIMINSEWDSTKVWVNHDSYSISHFSGSPVNEYFRNDWQHATEDEYNEKMSAAIALMSDTKEKQSA